MRLDVFIATRDSLPRNRAQFLIERGGVSVNWVSVRKVSTSVTESDRVEVLSDEWQWVSRSALKLLDFIEKQGIQITGKVCLDVGSSTGGWTQVLLQYWACRVVAVEVGTDQMHARIRSDARVELHEKMPIQEFTTSEHFDLIVGDISFISLREIFPHIARVASSDTQIVLLFKPQFEVPKHTLKKTGVPKSHSDIDHALQTFRHCYTLFGYMETHFVPSSLTGEAGNQEYLFALKKREGSL